MHFSDLIENLIQETTHKSLWLFAPELVLCVTIVLLLLVRLFNADRFLPPQFVALFCAVGAACVTWYQFYVLAQGPSPESLFSQSTEFFTGLLIYDHFTVFFRVFLLLFLVLVIALTILSGIPDSEDSPDFYSLLIGATIGMMLMSSANHLLILFLGVEMTSVPSYAMVGFLKGRKPSSEAALKYVVYGAGAAGVMLYGISLIAGLLGTGDLPEIASRMSVVAGIGAPVDAATVGISTGTVRTVVFGIMLVLVGLAFKLSLVPFHFWCPDAFEGASAEVAGFLSVASKAGAFALLVRFCLAFGGTDPGVMRDVYLSIGIGLGAIGALSATFGNLAAYTQKNVKRLLAYSTIAHAGYMVMAVGAMMVILNAPLDSGLNALDRQEQAARCLEGLLYYLTVYLFMNLGAFAVVALIRNQIFSEEIDDYNGIAAQAPGLCIGMLICMFSLVGLPPFGGFFGKLMIFGSLYEAGSVHWSMWLILALGGLNTVFSLFYYLRVLQAMFIRKRADGAQELSIDKVSVAYVVMVSVPVILLGMSSFAGGLSATARNVAATLIH